MPHIINGDGLQEESSLPHELRRCSMNHDWGAGGWVKQQTSSLAYAVRASTIGQNSWR